MTVKTKKYALMVQLAITHWDRMLANATTDILLPVEVVEVSLEFD